jgi:hypothetical protein
MPYLADPVFLSHLINPPRTSDIICHTINFSSFLTAAIFDATYNRTPFEPKPWFPVDKPNPTLYN